LVALRALTSVGLLKRYELYPATDPFLYPTPVRVAGPLLGVLLAGYIIVWIVRRYIPPSPGDLRLRSAFSVSGCMCWW
jgi:hypothetical protein